MGDSTLETFGMVSKQIAKKLKVHTKTVKKWYSRWFMTRDVVEKKKTGRPSMLTPRKKRKLVRDALRNRLKVPQTLQETLRKNSRPVAPKPFDFMVRSQQRFFRWFPSH